jgi:hypothetical protein
MIYLIPCILKYAGFFFAHVEAFTSCVE